MIIPAAALNSASAGEPVFCLPATSGAAFILPRNVRAPGYDERHVQAAIQGWQSVPIVRAQSWSERYDIMRERPEKRKAREEEEGSRTGG
jgi:hypothetical protein